MWNLLRSWALPWARSGGRKDWRARRQGPSKTRPLVENLEDRVVPCQLGGTGDGLSHHPDDPRTSATTQEVLLTPRQVRSPAFGKPAGHPVDGQVHADHPQGHRGHNGILWHDRSVAPAPSADLEVTDPATPMIGMTGALATHRALHTTHSVAKTKEHPAHHRHRRRHHHRSGAAARLAPPPAPTPAPPPVVSPDPLLGYAWPTRTVGVDLRPSLDPAEVAAAVEAIQDLDAQSALKFVIVDDPNAPVQVSDVGSLGGNILGEEISAYQGTALLTATVHIDGALAEGGGYDLATVFRHEFGHAAGLGHNLVDSQAVMWPSQAPGEVRPYDLNDALALQTLYS